jgi:tRNA pseudouridine55 synthase
MNQHRASASRRAPANINGFILVDKAAGPTSHAVVSAFKRALTPDRIGHLGTLDPFASGLLPVMFGGATRLADDAMDGMKGYTFTVSFGAETDTLDPSGQVVREAPWEHVTAAAIENALADFVGRIEQVPPAYSAIKMNGRPLYEYMRGEGKLPADIETKRRTIDVHSFVLDHFSPAGVTGRPEALLSVRCGKGTYVRCLARDLANALGSAGTCVTLRRTFVEPWSVSDSGVFPFDSRDALDPTTLLTYLRPPEEMVPHLRTMVFPAESHERSLLAGNIFHVEKVRIPWDGATGPVPELSQRRPGQGAEGFPEKALVRAGMTLYLAELLDVGDTVKVQPRKRLNWQEGVRSFENP